MFDKFSELVWTQQNPTGYLSQTQLGLICIATAVGCGLIIALAYLLKNPGYSKYLAVSLALMPIVVMSLVLVVNQRDGLGMGVAIAGAFALIRFRSVPGNSRDVLCVFFAMAVGVAIGATYIWFALTLTLIIGALFVGMKFIPLDFKTSALERDIRITVPEDLDYQTELAPVFAEFAASYRNIGVKTDKMGSLFVLDYRVRLKSNGTDKKLIDALRVRNGNLPIVCKTVDRETGKMM